jgi:hypothetical protein
MKALEVLTSKLQGSFISHFGVDDVWSLYVGGYWLIAQDIISEDEGMLNEWSSSIANMCSHNAYHTGQIVYIRKKNGWWQESKGVK